MFTKVRMPVAFQPAEQKARFQLPKHESQMGKSGELKHHSGWPFVVAALERAEGVGGILIDDFVERTFSPKRHSPTLRERIFRIPPRIFPIPPPTWKTPWVGIFHSPHNSPEWFHPAGNPRRILLEKRFRESCLNLRGAVTFSEYAAEWLRAELPVPVRALKHPTKFPTATFSWEAFEANEDKKLVQVGWYLRNYRAIYQVKAPEGLRKVHLSQNEHVIDQVRRATDQHSPHRSRPDVGDVHVMSRLDNAAYDRLLTENVIFIELFDASANNTVIEAIVRETPIVVNRHPAVVEYLGEGYPLFYDEIEEVPGLVTAAMIKRAHQYLADMEKNDLRIDHFICELKQFVEAVR